MLKPVIAAVLYEVILVLRRHSDFFGFDAEQRKKILGESALPVELHEYLSVADENAFMQDISGVIAMQKNDFARAVAQLLADRFTEYFDTQAVHGKGKIAESVKDLAARYSYQDIAAAITKYGECVGDMPYIVVQSPREIGSELRQSIRGSLKKEYPLSFPVFQVNPKLIGGLRIFKNGTTFDFSWLNRIHSFINF